jgi:hypothetical protein
VCDGGLLPEEAYAYAHAELLGRLCMVCMCVYVCACVCVRVCVLVCVCVCVRQACRVVQYGTVTVCTVRTVLVKLRRTTVIATPYFTVITVKYGTVYGTVPSWHYQCKNGLKMASSPQNLPFSLPGVLLPCANATQCFHERP